MNVLRLEVLLLDLIGFRFNLELYFQVDRLLQLGGQLGQLELFEVLLRLDATVSILGQSEGHRQGLLPFCCALDKEEGLSEMLVVQPSALGRLLFIQLVDELLDSLGLHVWILILVVLKREKGEQVMKKEKREEEK